MKKLLWVFLAFLWCHSAYSEDADVYRLSFDLKSAGADGRGSGVLTLPSSRGVDDLISRCIYLPLNDPGYDFDPTTGLSPSVVKRARMKRVSGKLEVQAKGRYITPYLFELAPEVSKVPFEILLPRWDEGGVDLWYFNDSYPQLLSSCSLPEERSNLVAAKMFIDIHAEIVVPDGWAVYHAGENIGTTEGQIRSRFLGSKFSFFLGRDQRSQLVDVGGVEIQVVYSSENFVGLIGYLQPFMSRAMKLFGPFPYKRMLLVETEDLEKSLTPGIVTLNREKYRDAKSKGNGRINWATWQLAGFLGLQWFGTAMAVQDIKDFWFFRGFGDFAAYVLLRYHPEANNLFAEEVNGLPLFDFSYSQAQDAMARILSILRPDNALTSKEGATLLPIEHQHDLGYVRHSLALRYLFWYLGPNEFVRMIVSFTHKYSFRTVKPETFISFLKSFPFKSENGNDVVELLLSWWSQGSWPDYFLKDVIEEGSSLTGVRKVKVIVGQNQSYHLPVDVTIRDITGKLHRKQAKPLGDILVAELEMDQPVANVEVNSGREVFDSNRFNNHNYGAKFSIFPGNARTLQDDAYTILWLPFFAKLPGEPFSILFGSQLLRYLNSGFSNIISYVPEEERFGFQSYFVTDIPKYGLYSIISLGQNYGSSLKGERLLEAGLYRTQFLLNDPSIEIGFRLRSRQTLGQDETLHQAVALRLKIEPLKIGSCYYQVKSDLEKTPLQVTQDFSYTRNFLIGKGGCSGWGGEVGLRVFHGSLSFLGNIPESIRFQPQSQREARLRIDQPRLEAVDSLSTLGIDILWPAKLGFSQRLLLLPRQSRWRIFLDYGEGKKNEKRYYEDGGVGLFIPMGANFVGKRSVAALQFTALVVLHKSYEGIKSSDPGIMFDFLGHL